MNFLVLHCMPLAQELRHSSPWRNLSFLLTDSQQWGFTAADTDTHIENNDNLELEDSIGLLHESLLAIANHTNYDSIDQRYDILQTIEIKKEKFRQVFFFCTIQYINHTQTHRKILSHVCSISVQRINRQKLIDEMKVGDCFMDTDYMMRFEMYYARFCYIQYFLPFF